jgi:hypothetical protein
MPGLEDIIRKAAPGGRYQQTFNACSSRAISLRRLIQEK